MDMIYFTHLDGNFHVYACQIDKQTETHITLVNRLRPIPKTVIDSRKPWYGHYFFSTFQKVYDFLNPYQEFETEYQKLARLQSDCKAYINRSDKNHLWARNPKDQIAEMRRIWELLPEKPDWCTKEDIDGYEEAMRE